ncbi:MAG: GNAT family N-acetyltransferase [Cytophagales bacterium]|nr:GNAT family N-acetyltransferase [Rhizobacter sp.]
MSRSDKPAPRWVPIRTLGERHRQRVLQHLLALPVADRVLRFGHVAGDEMIANYVAGINFIDDDVFGVFDRRLQLVAMAHLARPAADPPTAEFGVSVDASQRGRGIGGRLFERAVMHARNRGVQTLLVYIARDNVPMLALARRAGGTVQFEGSEGLARLALPADTLGSQIEELFDQQAAEFDYRLKMHTLRIA